MVHLLASFLRTTVHPYRVGGHIPMSLALTVLFLGEDSGDGDYIEINVWQLAGPMETRREARRKRLTDTKRMMGW